MIKLSWWEEFIIGAVVSFLTLLQSKITGGVFQLSSWESLIVTLAISFLTMLQGKITNTVVLDAIKATIAFLQQLANGGSIEAEAIQAAITFLQQLLGGTVAMA
jgi:hypothetical protein